MNAEFPSVKLTWQALLHALISWNRRHIVQGVYELHAQSSFMILRDTANNPICLFFLFLLKTLLLAQVKWCRKTNSHSIPIPHPLVCLLCAFHSTVQSHDLFPLYSCLPAPMSGKNQRKEIQYLGKIITTALKLAAAIQGHGSKVDFFFYLPPTWRWTKQKIVSL